jgi:hypothetical protein
VSDVRFGSKADIAASPINVRLPPKADIRADYQDVCFVAKADINPAVRFNGAVIPRSRKLQIFNIPDSAP